ncbi:hypothetical protein BOTBODRAFT_102424, partial [Botryobasidium botryosum FD-172 SS1]
MKIVIDHIQDSLYGFESDIDPRASGRPTLSRKEEQEMLDREISVMELAIRATNDYVDRTLSRLRSYRNLLAPVHLLPSELISDIFEFVERDARRRHEEPHVALAAPLIFASVSKHWRQIAMDTRNIWAYLDVSAL